MIELILSQAIQQPTALEILLPETVIEETIEEPEPIKVTWRDNPNNCNEDTQYIAKEEPFYCIDKPISAPRPSYSVSNGWYPYGQCTFWVSTKRPVGAWNDARHWAWQARRDGWSTGTKPVAGAIGQRGNHVVYVESVSGSMVNISEMNHKGLGVVSYRTLPASYFTYIY